MNERRCYGKDRDGNVVRGTALSESIVNGLSRGGPGSGKREDQGRRESENCEERQIFFHQ